MLSILRDKLRTDGLWKKSLSVNYPSTPEPSSTGRWIALDGTTSLIGLKRWDLPLSQFICHGRSMKSNEQNSTSDLKVSSPAGSSRQSAAASPAVSPVKSAEPSDSAFLRSGSSAIAPRGKDGTSAARGPTSRTMRLTRTRAEPARPANGYRHAGTYSPSHGRLDNRMVDLQEIEQPLIRPAWSSRGRRSLCTRSVRGKQTSGAPNRQSNPAHRRCFQKRSPFNAARFL
jgi:hypothetical protein